MKVRLSEIVALLEAPLSRNPARKPAGGGTPYGVAYIGTHARPGDGRNGLAYGRPPLSRLQKFPYDRNEPDNTYGQPGNIPDRGDAGHRPDHAPGGPEPVDTAHSEWDKLHGVVSKQSGFEEASGTPMNFTMSGRGGQELGNPAPGMGGNWANRPVKPWDEDGIDDDELEKFGRAAEAIEFRAPPRNEDSEEELAHGIPVEAVPNPDPEHWGDTSDASLEHLLGRIGLEPEMHPEDDLAQDTCPVHDMGSDPADQYTEFPSVLMAMPTEPTFQSGLGRAMTPGRGFQTGWTETYDIMVPESMVWETIAKLLGIS